MTLLDQATQLETERRALDTTLRERVQALIDAARREGFELGFRAGQQTREATP